MKRKRHSSEQIVRKLREAEADLGNGLSLAQVCQKLEISQATYHRWRQLYGSVTESAVKRLRALEKENVRLKKLVAEQALDVSLLKEVARGNF